MNVRFAPLQANAEFDLLAVGSCRCRPIYAGSTGSGWSAQVESSRGWMHLDSVYWEFELCSRMKRLVRLWSPSTHSKRLEAVGSSASASSILSDLIRSPHDNRFEATQRPDPPSLEPTVHLLLLTQQRSSASFLRANASTGIDGWHSGPLPWTPPRGLQDKSDQQQHQNQKRM